MGLAVLVATVLSGSASASPLNPSAPKLVEDINPSGSSAPAQFFAWRETLFFAASDGVHGRELWSSDGTEAGTRMVKDINAAGNGSPYQPVNLDGTLLFFADDGVHGRGLWRSDGTEAGTQLVKEIPPQKELYPGSYSYFLVVVGHLVFFIFDDGVHGSELWSSDGTEAGTRMVKDINPSGSASFWRTAYNASGTLLFFVDNGAGGGELWSSDGTEAGTRMVKDINPSGSSVSATSSSFLFSKDLGAAGALLFIADDGVHGRELWSSDGTEAGTRMVKDINPSGGSAPPALLYSGGIPLYFYASDGEHGTELWRSDGTEAGTKLVKDIGPGPKSGGPSTLYEVNGSLYFPSSIAYDAKCSFELEDCLLSFELYLSDGTEAGTGSIERFESYSTQLMLAGLGDKHLFGIVPAEEEGGGFFGGTPQSSTAGLWIIDPIAKHTDLISDGLYVYKLFSLGPSAVISAGEPGTGQELWVTDGTAAETRLLKDIYPGPDGSIPQQFIRVGRTLFFTADNGADDRELWALDTDHPPTAFDDEATFAEDAEATPIDVLANDTDLDGGPKKVSGLTQPARGTAVITASALALTYQPDPDFCGLDSFDYELNGGSTATVSVTVTCTGHSVTVGDAGSAITEGTVSNKADFALCVARARRVFHRQRAAAMQANGKVRARAMKRVRKRVHRAVSACKVHIS